MKIIITTPGNFSKSDKTLLIKKGICVIEAKKPEEVKVIGEASFGDADQLLLSAMDALKQSNSSLAQSGFFDSLYGRLKNETHVNMEKPIKPTSKEKEPTKETILKEKIPAY